MSIDKATIINSLLDLARDPLIDQHSYILHLDGIVSYNTVTLQLHRNYLFNLLDPKNVIIALTNVMAPAISNIKITMDESKYGIRLPADSKESMLIKLNEIMAILTSDKSTTNNTFIYFVNNKKYDKDFTIDINDANFVHQFLPEMPCNLVFVVRGTTFNPHNFALSFDLTGQEIEDETPKGLRELSTILKYRCPDTSRINVLLVTTFGIIFVLLLSLAIVFIRYKREER